MTDPAAIQDEIWSGLAVVAEESDEQYSWRHSGYVNPSEVPDIWPDYDIEPVWNQMQVEKAENRTTAEITELVDPIYQDDSDPDYTLTGLDNLEIMFDDDDTEED